MSPARERAPSYPLRPILFWITAVVLTAVLYYLCLRFLFPGYFTPLAPFHVDFYDYVGAREKTFLQFLLQYPRPVAYMGMKIMAAGGLASLMRAEIAVALVNVVLTMALARKLLRLHSPWLLGAFALYLALLFAHPAFYFEHRHDLPAELSYLFLLLSLFAWLQWTKNPVLRNAAYPVAAFLFAILFVFAKETFFIAAPCLVLGLALAEPARRRAHLGFLAGLLLLEAASLKWNSHLNGPFVNASADVNATYHVNLHPAVIASTYGYYLYHLLTPALLLIVSAAFWVTRRNTPRLITAASFALAGLAVFAPHAVLPNHKFQEYSWAAAPLFAAPALLLFPAHGNLQRRLLICAGLFTAALAAIAAPGGYQSRYQTGALSWMVNEDRMGGRIAGSLQRYSALPRPSRILITGLEDPAIPWQEEDFLRTQFGPDMFWTVVLPNQIEPRKNSSMAQFVDASEVRLSDVNYVAEYDNRGALVNIAPAAAQNPVPELRRVQTDIQGHPHDVNLLLNCAAIAVKWGIWKQADICLEKAGAEGAARAPAFQAASAALRTGRNLEAARPPDTFTLEARPAHLVQADGSGLAATELSWRTPSGVPIEIHVDAPNGPLFFAGQEPGSAQTGKWVKDGMQFFLQDIRSGKPLTREHTKAIVTVTVTRSN